MSGSAFLVAFTILSLVNLSYAETTVATWYGNPTGGGGGGACGYYDDVNVPPYSKLTAAGGSALFNGGKGCGECYQVSCTSNPMCSGKPVKIVITNLCPGSCGATQFDLSGVAFGAMANPGQEAALRALGKLDIVYERVPCSFGVKVTFKIDKGANPFFFSTAIEYINGDGDLGKVELSNNGGPFVEMQELFGATYKLNSPTKFTGPLSIRFTTLSGKSLVANNVIPVGWSPGQVIKSNVNF